MHKAKPGETLFDDWLAVSTDGFAAMNAGRDPAHLVKELVQNALDALGSGGGQIRLDCRADAPAGPVHIVCSDSGCGMKNLADIRTVFHTTKTDSHLQRGRMGRGFKELLCLAVSASVSSGGGRIEFVIEGGRRITRQTRLARPASGTRVQMLLPWPASVISCLESYFQTLLVPPGVELAINGQAVTPRDVDHRIDATLPTELYEDGRWIRPGRRTVIELVRTRLGEEPLVYELGIPVCPVTWTVPYHANIRQRVPMNPCRDAVASGYLLRVHRSCLPVLLSQMDSEQVRQDWVGAAAPYCDPPIQKQLIRLGFGPNIARSVPAMGVRQYDEDAREIGATVIDTRQTSGGFRQILQEHVPTSRQVVDQHNHARVAAAASGGFVPADLRDGDQRRRLIEAAGGRDRVEQVMGFARWFCQKLLDGYADSSICSVTLAELRPVGAVATWNSQDVLTLGIDTPGLWSEPLGEESLSTLIHEAAHHLNAHHGRDFHAELEKLAGRAARIMLVGSGHVEREFAGLLTDR